ncbi:MAG: hypothetical protein Q4P06_00675 [Actinomycetaceae bacterium]|nr:hypothetical protein [Actinomycetaceae bacterium]
METTTDSAKVRSAKDRRGPAYGWGRVFIAAFWVVAVVATYTALSDFFALSQYPLGPRLVSVLAGLGYVLAAIALSHNGRRMRKVAGACIGFELSGVLITGIVGLGVPQIGQVRNLWANFGQQYWFIPLILPLLGIAWLWWSNPRRIVEIAEKLDR